MSKKESDLTNMFTQLIDKHILSAEEKLFQDITEYINLQLHLVNTSIQVYEIKEFISDSCAKQYNQLQGQKSFIEGLILYLNLKHGRRFKGGGKRSITSDQTFPGGLKE